VGSFRGISLLIIPGKVYTKVLPQRVKKYAEEIMTADQAGFRSDRVTLYHLLVM
jgi:hypothetical protein